MEEVEYQEVKQKVQEKLYKFQVQYQQGKVTYLQAGIQVLMVLEQHINQERHIAQIVI